MVPLQPELLGGHLCLDFVNTVHHRFREGSRDFLDDFNEWLNWSVHAGALSASEANKLKFAAGRDRRLAESAFERVLTLRTVAYSILTDTIKGVRPSPEDIAGLNQVLADAAAHRLLVHSEPEWAWQWRGDVTMHDLPLWRVAFSLSELLTKCDLTRIRECPAPDGCGWLFLDASKNRSRRWCSMRHCGTSSKVRQHRSRKRARPAAGA